MKSGKVIDMIKFDIGSVAMVIAGNSIGRICSIEQRERQPGSFEIIHLKDSAGDTFTTRLNNVFVIGMSGIPWISLLGPTPQTQVKLEDLEDDVKHKLELAGYDEVSWNKHL